MKNILVIAVFLYTALSIYGQCSDIRTMIESNDFLKLDLKKEIVYEKGVIQVYKDFVFINDVERGLLREINYGRNLKNIYNLLNLDSIDYIIERDKDVPLEDLMVIRDSIPLPNRFYFYTIYNSEFVVIARLLFSSSEWEDDKVWEEFSEMDLEGFEISAFPARLHFYTFKCDEKGNLVYIRTDDYTTICR